MRINVFFLFLFLSSSISAQTPGANRYAVFFVNRLYEKNEENQNQKWANLDKAGNEPEQIAEELRINYNYKIITILDPKKQQILDTLEFYMLKTYGTNDQILFFFSGHGYYDAITESGYYNPSDGKIDDPTGKSWLSYTDLGKYLTLNKCSNLMLCLDACYSGSFGTRYQYRTKPEASITDQILDCSGLVQKSFKHKNRRFFTSGSKSARTPAKSLFAYQFLEALRQGGTNGIVTTLDIEKQMLRIETPEPESGYFLGNDPGGDFLFINKNACTTIAPDNPDLRDWDYAQQQNTIQAYEFYINAHPNGKFLNPCNTKLERLREDIFWKLTSQQNTPAVYQQYLSRYPNGFYADEARKRLSPPDIITQMVLIPGGSFMMGSNDTEEDEKPIHQVWVSSFYMSKFEITVAQFKAFVEDADYITDAEKRGFITYWRDGGWKTRKGVNWRYGGDFKLRPESEFSHPVLYISWNDANQYCLWLSEKTDRTYRLPTEAEWEYAAGNGKKHTKYSWGDRDPSGKRMGNVLDSTARKNFPDWPAEWFDRYQDGFVYTAPVGSFEGNDWGLFDMSGNTNEWCNDRYEKDYYKQSPPQGDPQGPDTGNERVFRGGSWSEKADFSRIVLRGGLAPDWSSLNTGFRIARNGPWEDSKAQLKTERNPTIEQFQSALTGLKSTSKMNGSTSDARNILLQLGVTEASIQTVNLTDHFQMWGKLPTGLEVRLWSRTYGKDCFGIRFQRDDLLNFVGVNTTYFEYCY